MRCKALHLGWAFKEGGTPAPELEQAATESGILGSLLPCGLSHPKKTTPLGHTVNQRTPTFNFLLGNTLFFFPTLIQGFKKHSSPPSGYNTLQQVAAFLQLQRVSVLTFTFPCGIPSTASLLLMQRHFSQKGALFAISLPPPPPQLQRSPGSPQLPQPTPVPSQLQQPKPTGGQKGDLTSAVPC